MILEENHYLVDDENDNRIIYRRGNIEIRLMKIWLDSEYLKLVARRIDIPNEDFFERYGRLRARAIGLSDS